MSAVSEINNPVENLAQERHSTLANRRKFIGTLVAGAATAGAATLTGCSDDGPIVLPSVTPSVVDVLNFALNLEYLEASFYLYTTTGSGLATADMGGNPGAVSGGAKVNFTNTVVASAATQIAAHERAHVQFLRSTITAVGGTPVSMPALNLAAGGTVNSDATFVAAARQLEDVGVSAYAGAARYLTSSAQALTYASQILHTEAQHSGLLRELCIVLNVTSPAVDSQDLPPTTSQVFATGKTNGLAPARTTSQVLQIVYGSAGNIGISKGGFFPNGLNGSILTS